MYSCVDICRRIGKDVYLHGDRHSRYEDIGYILYMNEKSSQEDIVYILCIHVWTYVVNKHNSCTQRLCCLAGII